MLLKSSTITFCCSPAHTTSPTQHLPSITSSLRPCPYRQQQQSQQQQQRQSPRCQRGYASQAGDGRETSKHRIPDWPRSLNPTPYEIFDINRKAPYTKHRFYQLVKLYHPDKHHHASSSSSSSSSASAPSISPSTRLERYRLVIAANDLLSSPSKRALYDTHGLGWSPSSNTHHIHDSLRRADRAWRHNPNSAAHNATWEDWERWHEAQSGAANHARKPLYMSNGMFASIIIAMCMVGAMAQKSRAESIGDEYVEWKARRHAEIGKELNKRGMEMAGMGRDERVESFVRDRENANYAYAPGKYDSIPNR